MIKQIHQTILIYLVLLESKQALNDKSYLPVNYSYLISIFTRFKTFKAHMSMYFYQIFSRSVIGATQLNHEGHPKKSGFENIKERSCDLTHNYIEYYESDYSHFYDRHMA